MKQYKIICPYCGTKNTVYLDETEGWMECTNCLNDVQISFIYLDTAS